MSKKPTRPSNELRSAFKALKVSSPLRLSKAGPAMRPPNEAPQSNLAQMEAPRFEVPLLTSAQSELPQNEATSKTMDRETFYPPAPQSELPQKKLTQKERPSFEVSQNVGPTSEGPRHEATTNAEHMAHSEPPQIEDRDRLFEGKSTQGFFKLAHSIFSEPLVQQLSGDSFRLFLWLSCRAWRFSKSNGQVRASVRFIEEHTGMSHATVSRALKTLREKSLIQLVETDFKRGNIWRVSAVALGVRGPEDGGPNGEKPQNEDTQEVEPTTSNRGASVLKSSTKVPRNEGNIRSIKNPKDSKKDQTRVLGPIQTQETEFEREQRELAIQRFEMEVAAGDQDRVVQRFVEREFPHGFLPPPRVIRNMAAWDWAKGASPAEAVAS